MADRSCTARRSRSDTPGRRERRSCPAPLLRGPIEIGSSSARKTAPNQTAASRPKSASSSALERRKVWMLLHGDTGGPSNYSFARHLALFPAVEGPKGCPPYRARDSMRHIAAKDEARVGGGWYELPFRSSATRCCPEPFSSFCGRPGSAAAPHPRELQRRFQRSLGLLNRPHEAAD